MSFILLPNTFKTSRTQVEKEYNQFIYSFYDAKLMNENKIEG